MQIKILDETNLDFIIYRVFRKNILRCNTHCALILQTNCSLCRLFQLSGNFPSEN